MYTPFRRSQVKLQLHIPKDLFTNRSFHILRFNVDLIFNLLVEVVI